MKTINLSEYKFTFLKGICNVDGPCMDNIVFES